MGEANGVLLDLGLGVFKNTGLHNFHPEIWSVSSLLSSYLGAYLNGDI